MGVVGVGGVFLRADDPVALAQWYATHLDVGSTPHGLWQVAAGPSVFMPFARTDDYWPTDRAVMLNFRVEGLDALIAALTAAGIAVRTDPNWDMPGVGRFARITDPEGNPVELWEAG